MPVKRFMVNDLGEVFGKLGVYDTKRMEGYIELFREAYCGELRKLCSPRQLGVSNVMIVDIEPRYMKLDSFSIEYYNDDDLYCYETYSSSKAIGVMGFRVKIFESDGKFSYFPGSYKYHLPGCASTEYISLYNLKTEKVKRVSFFNCMNKKISFINEDEIRQRFRLLFSKIE